MTKEPHQETRCVHGGGLRDAATGGINSPIYTSTAADYLDRDRVPYQRYFNTPNQEAVVRKVCALEGAQDGVLFSSGMAAISRLQPENRPFSLPPIDPNPGRQRRADVIDHARQRVKMIVKKAWPAFVLRLGRLDSIVLPVPRSSLGVEYRWTQTF